MKTILLLLWSVSSHATWYGILCNESNGNQILYHAENNTTGMGEGLCWDERKDGLLPANVVPGAMTMTVDSNGKKSMALDLAKKSAVDAAAANAALKRASDAKDKSDCDAVKARFAAGTDTGSDQRTLSACAAKGFI